MSLLCYFSVMLAKALPFPVITGSNSHHTLTWSRRPNMFFPQHWEFIAWTMFCPYIAQIRSFSQHIHMSVWPDWVPGVRALNIHTHFRFVFTEHAGRPVRDVVGQKTSTFCCMECVLSVVTSSNSSHHRRDNYQVWMLRGFLCTPISNYALQGKLRSVFHNSCFAYKV